MLNTEHFVLLGGNPQKWDDEVRIRNAAGEDLGSIQEDQHARGRRTAVLTESVKGWYVRAGSDLDDIQVLMREDGTTKAEAIAWGCAWANKDPENREFITRRTP